MAPFSYPFSFLEVDSSRVDGHLDLDDPVAYPIEGSTDGNYRTGTLTLDADTQVEVVLYHNAATATFIYLQQRALDQNLMALAGISPEEFAGVKEIFLPGQLCLGASRGKLMEDAMVALIGSPVLAPVFSKYQQHNLAVFPIAREGLKYQVPEAIYANYGFYCDEIILDAHHVFDSSVPIYNRKVEMTLFKDKDLDTRQKENIHVAFIADSIASGLVMKEVIERIKDRFDGIQQVEVIAPLATVRGLCRVASGIGQHDLRVRVHVFETLLNALPPDYYYSAHFPAPEFHICPDLEEDYRRWWGNDAHGQEIADTACAGYGWSEVFYSPRKQIEMINEQLTSRHGLAIADLIRRNLQR
jgi:hypothetical protein